MDRLQLYLLGSPRVEINGKPLTLRRQKGLALLAYLATAVEPVRRDLLATLLWTESSQSKARTSLRSEVSYLNRLLNGCLHTERETVGLSREHRWLDVEEFEKNLADATDLVHLVQAVDLYRGDFLSGFSLADAQAFDEWHFFQAETYRRQQARALEQLTKGYRERGEYATALDYSRRLLALDPLEESVHRELMALYGMTGQWAAAVRQYKECVRILDEELGVPPEEATATLFNAIRTRRIPQERQVVAQEPTTVAVSTQPAIEAAPLSNLPAQTTPFIGREREVEDVLTLLAAPEHRLVSITGVGGMGKSRLGLAVAEAVQPDFGDGVWFVPLANVDSAEAVPNVIAAVLSIPQGAKDVRTFLFGHLRDKHLLLLLDNYEHLLESAELLSDLLQTAPQVKLLVTSQERLNLHEESVYPLTGLATGDQDEDREGFSALALFDLAARRVKPDFVLEEEKANVAEICRILEGMPLAIELASGWVRIMSCQEIATEIQNSTDFLNTTLRNLPARHRSIRAVFERSWGLLGPDEQTVLGCLSVFQGGFDRKGAGAVAGATPQMLMSLIDCSLIRRQENNRFDMHGLVQRFAAEQLAGDHSEEEQTRNRHADYYASMVSRAGWELEPGDALREAALAGEEANVLAAWHWGVQQLNGAHVRSIMRWLLDYFRRRGEYQGGQAAFSCAVSAFRPSADSPGHVGILGSLLLRLSKLYTRIDQAKAVQYSREAVERLREAQPFDPLELAQALARLAGTTGLHGRNPEFTEMMDEAVSLFRNAGNDLGVGATLRDWSILETSNGQYREAQRHLKESMLVLDGLDRLSHAQSSFILGMGFVMQGDYRRAETLLQRALPVMEELKEEVLAAYVLRNLGALYTAIGEFSKADHYFTEAYARFEPIGMAYLVTTPTPYSTGVLARLCGTLDAEDKLRYGLEVSKQFGLPNVALSQYHLAVLLHDRGNYEGAMEILDEALEFAREINHLYAVALVQTQRGQSLAALQKRDSANAALIEALRISEREELASIASRAIMVIAQLMVGDGEIDHGIELLSFVQACEASEWETKQRAQLALSELGGHLSANAFHTAQETGQRIELAQTITGALEWLGSNTNYGASGVRSPCSLIQSEIQDTKTVGR